MRGGQNFIDHTGQRFGRLTVVSRGPTLGGPGNRKVSWNCICDCGKEVRVAADSLRRGCTSSCGCLHKELIREKATKHDGSRSKLYGVWNMMRQRCCNPRNRDYKFYGARGISVCAEWLDFSNFRDWATTAGYGPGLTIDRIDGDKNYCPSNCQWITIEEQQKNRRPPRKRGKRTEVMRLCSITTVR